MKINYNVTGPKRKRLVAAISQMLNAPTKYLGAPTFAYEVGDYHTDKAGMLSGDDNPKLVADLLRLHDFKAIAEEYDTPILESEPTQGDVPIPSEEVLDESASHVDKNEETLEDEDDNQIDEVDANCMSIEMTRSDFNDAAIENLKRLVESKSTLIKKAIGTNRIPIVVGVETINFPWFQSEIDSDEVKAYTHFIAALCEMAKTQQRVNATERQVENEKYTFRCFLIRLGFVGSEHKAVRKILLKNLSGNSAFKNGAPAKPEEVTADE